MTMRQITIILAAALLLGACSLERLPGVYRIDVQQGNVVTPAMLEQLRPGMTREQVRFVMGTPMVDHTFRDERWDYYFSYQPGRGERSRYHLALVFDGDLLTRVDGELPPEVAGLSDLSGTRTVAVTGELPESRGMLDRAWDALTDWELGWWGKEADAPAETPEKGAGSGSN